MTVYIENYGSDIDGNRGQKRRVWELDKDDEPYIIEQIKEYQEQLNEDEDLPEELEVYFVCPITEEDVYFTINPKHYV
jgi:hypothetical protein